MNSQIIKGNYNITKLKWEDQTDIDEMAKNSDFDLIICSELVYWEDLFDSLINVLRTLCKAKIKIYFIYKVRMKDIIEKFFEMLGKYFDVVKVVIN